MSGAQRKQIFEAAHAALKALYGHSLCSTSDGSPPGNQRLDVGHPAYDAVCRLLHELPNERFPGDFDDGEGLWWKLLGESRKKWNGPDDAGYERALQRFRDWLRAKYVTGTPEHSLRHIIKLLEETELPWELDHERMCEQADAGWCDLDHRSYLELVESALEGFQRHLPNGQLSDECQQQWQRFRNVTGGEPYDDLVNEKWKRSSREFAAALRNEVSRCSSLGAATSVPERLQERTGAMPAPLTLREQLGWFQQQFAEAAKRHAPLIVSLVSIPGETTRIDIPSGQSLSAISELNHLADGVVGHLRSLGIPLRPDVPPLGMWIDYVVTHQAPSLTGMLGINDGVSDSFVTPQGNIFAESARVLAELIQNLPDHGPDSDKPKPDSSDYVLASAVWRNRFDTYKQFTGFIKNCKEIRTRKPAPKRLAVHAGDWLRYWAEYDRRQSENLDKEAIQETIEDIEARKTKARRMKRGK